MDPEFEKSINHLNTFDIYDILLHDKEEYIVSYGGKLFNDNDTSYPINFGFTSETIKGFSSEEIANAIYGVVTRHNHYRKTLGIDYRYLNNDIGL